MHKPKYIKVDLTTGTTQVYEIPDDITKKYIGGKILAAHLLYTMTEAGIDPLSEESMVIINTGPLNGTGAPCSSRFNMTFKNVLTGGIATSNCGGTFGLMLKRAGYDGLIITGKAEGPSMIEILDGNVTIKDASHLWGMDTEETQENLPKHYGKFVIGPAGENKVLYASVTSGERVAGRCGGGAVFGAKNLKAITAYGTADAYVENPEKFKKYIKKWIKFLRNHPLTGYSLPKYGSAGLLNKANASGALPTKNFKEGKFKDADIISGETLTETVLVRNSNCISCPIRCERRVKVDGKEVKGPEYETLGFFGPNVNASDMESILKLNYLCDLYGMDTISCASSIAFAMELKEKGIVDLGVTFGDAKGLIEALKNIANREGISADIADGSKRMSEKYGGKEYAMHAKGLEMASYEPRRSVGMGLGYATSNRGGCHLNGGYAALFESVGVLSIDPQNPKAKPQLTVFLQDTMDAVSAGGSCLFSAQSVVPAVLFKLGPNHVITRMIGRIATHAGPAISLMLKSLPILKFNSLMLMPHAEAIRLATGLPIKTGSFLAWGDLGYNLERMYNIREGLTSTDDALPDRMTKEPQIEGRADTVVPMDKMLPKYYKVRGWDENGVPKQKKLKKLGII